MGLLDDLLDRYAVLVDPYGSVNRLDALRFIRARLPELGQKDTDQYYKALPEIRHRLIGERVDRDGVDQGIEVEVPNAALPDPGLDWSF